MPLQQLQQLKKNHLYLLFNNWDREHVDFYKVVELQDQPNGSLVFYCEEEHAFYDPKDIHIQCLEDYSLKRTIIYN